jgi:hypothetical protein
MTDEAVQTAVVAPSAYEVALADAQKAAENAEAVKQQMISTLKGEIKTLNDQLSAKNVALAALVGKTGKKRGRKPGKVTKTTTKTGDKSPGRKSDPNAGLRGDILAILKGKNGMKITEIEEAMKAKGHTSKSLYSQIAQLLGKNPTQFVKISRGSYKVA